MTRVRIQNVEEDGATGEVWIRDTASANGGAYGPAGGGGLPADGTYNDITVSGAGTVWTYAGTLDEVPAPVASVQFSQQQALQFRIENRTSDPGSPAVGEIWLRTDL